MQIAMHSVSDIGTIDRMFTPYDDTGFRSYLRDRYEKTMDYLEKASTNAGRAFIERSRRVFDSINSSEALRAARAALRTANSLRDDKNIFNIKNLFDLQAANGQAQRWLMANPIVRERYHRQLCDGYSDSYIDNTPDDRGEDHYEYRRVMNGVFTRTKTGEDEETIEHTRYYEVLLDGDRELDPEEQFAILDLWDLQNRIFDAGLDATSSLGGSLG